MKTTRLVAGALLAAGVWSSAAAQQALPDWEARVSAAIKEPERARKVTEAVLRYEAKRQASLEAMRAADGEMRAVFLRQSATVGDRQLSLNILRDNRRKAALSAVDALLEVRFLVEKKEWKAIWPESFFGAPGRAPLLAGAVQAALPSVIADPSRLKQAEGVATALVQAANTDEAARKKATSRFAGLLERYESQRDEFIELVNSLEETQLKVDGALVEGSGRLQGLLTPQEWDELVRRVTQPVP